MTILGQRYRFIGTVKELELCTLQGKRIKIPANVRVPLGTALLQSPGWNEGKARNETLGTHERKVISSSVGAALTVRVSALRCGCAAPTGLNKCGKRLTQGLRPGL